MKKTKKIKPRLRDWIVGLPAHGFTYPAFIERSTDVNAIMYYTKNAKEPHPELMEQALGCNSKQTATVQKETFQTLIQSYIGADEIESDEIYTQVQENLNTMVEEHSVMSDDTEYEPIVLTTDNVEKLLKESGVSEEIATKTIESFEENFARDLPLAESLLDTKLLKANEQKKKEEHLIKQVEVLETKLEEVQSNLEPSAETATDTADAELADNDIVEGPTTNYDVVLHVKPEKISKIKTEIINGQRCILVPINDDEQATINGKDDII